MIQPRQNAHPKFFRPAYIEIRSATKAEQVQAVNQYSQALNQLLPNPVPDSTYFPIGIPAPAQQGGGNNPHSMELGLLFIPNTKPELTNRTIVYWEIDAYDNAGLKQVYKDLVDHYNYKEVEPPPPTDTSTQGTSKGPTQLSLLTGPSGTLVGLIINPRIPLGLANQSDSTISAARASLPNPEKGEVHRSGYSMAMAGLTGLLIGAFANRLGKK